MGKFNLKGASVVITGASRGIGRACAIEFARAGANLTLAARSTDLLEEVAAEARTYGVRAIAVAADVTDPAGVARLVAAARKEYGRVDVMHANAGGGLMGPMLDQTIEQWRSLFELDFWGVMNSIYAVLDEMVERRSGQIIITNSISGLMAVPTGAAYSAAKFALTSMADSLRTEIEEHNVDVISIHPGFVVTNFHAAMSVAGLENVPPDLGAKLGGISAEDQARQIVKASIKRKPMIIGSWYGNLGARLLPLSHRLAILIRRLVLKKSKEYI